MKEISKLLKPEYMETTLEEYLSNPSDFSDEQLNEIGKLSIKEEKFHIEGQKKEILFEMIKKFFTAKGLNISNGKLKDTFHINNEEKFVGVLSFISHETIDCVYVNVSLCS